MVNGQVYATTALPLKEKSQIPIDNFAQFLDERVPEERSGGVTSLLSCFPC